MPGAQAKDFLDYQDPNRTCSSTKVSSLDWEIALLVREPTMGPGPRPYAAHADSGGGLWLTGTSAGQLWLGRVGSDGSFVASMPLPAAPGGPRVGYAMDRDARGQMAIVGKMSTEMVDFTEPVGVYFQPNRVDPREWRVQGLQGRPTSKGRVRLVDEKRMIVTGGLRYGENQPGAFVAKVDERGTKLWAIDQSGWDLTRVYDIAVDAKGAVYAIGGILSSALPESERAVMVKIDAKGTLLWQRHLEPEEPDVYTRSTRLALSLDQTQVWAVGATGRMIDGVMPRAWRFSGADGVKQAAIDLEGGNFEQGSTPAFSGILVREDGIYYAWDAPIFLGEDFFGYTSRVARMDAQGRTTWKAEYAPTSGPQDVPHVNVAQLVSGVAGGVYVVGQRLRVPVPDSAPQGESYGYVARFCPPL